jgi:hypothetical protein
MMSRRSASEILQLLGEIERELTRYYAGEVAGEDADAVVENIAARIGQLRNVLWHEVPAAFARRMDEEDGVVGVRGVFFDSPD